MNQPTKAELKDRIADYDKYVDCKEKTIWELKGKIVKLEGVVSNQREEIQMIERNLDWHIARGKRATIAAYALLATLVGIVISEFGALPW